jgi:fatty acid-binding protein DegV
MERFKIVTDATSDCPKLCVLHRRRHHPMDVQIGGTTYSYSPGGPGITAEAFYAELRRGNTASTSQNQPADLYACFENT